MQNVFFFFFFNFYKGRLPHYVEKKTKEVGVPEVGVSGERVCYKIVFLRSFKMWSLQFQSASMKFSWELTWTIPSSQTIS